MTSDMRRRTLISLPPSAGLTAPCLMKLPVCTSTRCTDTSVIFRGARFLFFQRDTEKRERERERESDLIALLLAMLRCSTCCKDQVDSGALLGCFQLRSWWQSWSSTGLCSSRSRTLVDADSYSGPEVSELSRTGYEVFPRLLNVVLLVIFSSRFFSRQILAHVSPKPESRMPVEELDYLSRECEQTTAPDGTSVPSFGMCTLHTSTWFCLRVCVFACLLLVYCFAAWGRSHSFCLHLQLRAFPAQKKNPALRSVESFQVQQVWLTWIEPRLQAWLLLWSPREAFQRRGSTRRLGGKLLFLGNLNLAPSIGCPTRIPGTHSW